MSDYNVSIADFKNKNRIVMTDTLYQYDYGQKLQIVNIAALPQTFEAHFSNVQHGGVSITVTGMDGIVDIPNTLLMTGKRIYCWIYVTEPGSGETVYQILLPVQHRPMPEYYDVTDVGVFDSVVQQVGDYAATATAGATSATASAAAAATSEANAAASASAAETAKNAAETAQGKAEDAQAAAETAAQTATEKAQQTAQDADQAASDAGRAESAAQSAEAAQTGAESAKTDAETAAQGAAASASAASASATSAGQAATSAAQSATAAAQSAASIEGDVQTATQKAAEATAAAEQAVTAKDAAVTAQTAAETAASTAAANATTASTKASEAAQSATSAALSKTDAEAAATRAETAAASLTVDSALSDSSVNPVQNRVVTESVTQLKSHIDAIAPSVEIPYTLSASSSNNYYRTLNAAPKTAGEYAIKLTASTTGYHTFQIGTRSDTSYMVDTIGTFHMTADVPLWVYGFTPSGNDYIYIRNSVGDSWDAEFYELYTDMAEDVRDSKANIAQNTSDIAEVKNLTTTSRWANVTLSLQNGYYYKGTGTYYAESDKRTGKINVNPGEVYKLSTYTRSTLIPGIMFFDSNDGVIGELLNGTGTGTVITDYEFTVPNNVASMAVQSADANQAVPVLYKLEKFFIGYTKAQIDSQMALVPKRYGVKWSLTDADDLGQRCFGAVGLNASIGIGTTNGTSDFDAIYPWSEIKRCNIRVNANGAKIITYEGESGFALDGSNGDVFVRIPKFYYERYRADGYEYRVVSSSGIEPHPVFKESGKILDEIFVGAFEGNIVATKLRSVGGVIPTGNEIGQAFLDAAEANGTGFTLYDMRTVDAVWTLLAVEFGCRNTNQIFGYGWADFLQPVSGTYGIDCDTAGTTNIFSASKSIPSARVSYMPVGSNCTICKGTQDNVIASRKITAITSDADHWYITFDGDPVELDTTCFIGSAGCTTNFCETAPTGALSWHTGRANWISGSVTRNPIRYRWMENLVGSLWHLLPDVTFNNLQMYACDDITKYSIGAISDGYTPIGDTLSQQSNNGSKADTAGTNYWISDLDNFSFGKGYDFGKTWDTALISTKAFGAYYYLSNGLRYIANGGGFDHLYRCNMLTQRAWIAPSNKWYLYGARLMYKHLN